MFILLSGGLIRRQSWKGENRAPLYARVQGFTWELSGMEIDYNTFKILKRDTKLEEYRKSPIAVVKKLLYVDLEPLLFPCVIRMSYNSFLILPQPRLQSGEETTKSLSLSFPGT